MRLASTDVIAEAVKTAKADLDRAVTLWQFVAEQRLLGGMPALMEPPADGDPLQHAAWHGRLEDDDRQAQLTLLDALHRLRNHMAGVEDSIRRVRRARVALGARVPAVDAAVSAHEASAKVGVGPDGRVGTSGVSLEEADRQKRGAVEAERACSVCDLGVSVVGRLKQGMCPTDYQAWWRDGRPERQPWVLRRREEAGGGGEAKVIPLHAVSYRDDLREVA